MKEQMSMMEEFHRWLRMCRKKIIKKNVTVINMIRIYLFLKAYQAD